MAGWSMGEFVLGTCVLHRTIIRYLFRISDEASFSSPEPQQLAASSFTSSAPPSDSPPPVVILSGVSKDVPSGLIFGFDINEQLLLEDSGGGGDGAPPQQQLPNSNVVVSGQNVSENVSIEFFIMSFFC